MLEPEMKRKLALKVGVEEGRCKDKIPIRDVYAFEAINYKITRDHLKEIDWLDICCGSGTILERIDGYFEKHICRKIGYIGIDIEHRYIKECEEVKSARNLGDLLRQCEFHVIEVEALQETSQWGQFDFVTVLNVLHEIQNPIRSLPSLLLKMGRYCKESGSIMVVDMVDLPDLEYAAITWDREKIKKIFSVLVKDEGVQDENKISVELEHIAVERAERRVPVVKIHLYKDQLSELLKCKEEDDYRKLERRLKSAVVESLKEKEKELLIAIGEYAKTRSATDKKVLTMLWSYWACMKALAEGNEA